MHPARLCTTSEPLPPAWTPAAHLRLPVTVLSTPNPRGCTPQSYQADRPPYCQEVRVETCTCICHMCARAHPPPYCPPTLQFGGFAPNVIIGEPDGSDSAPSNDIVCNGRSRGGVVAQTVTAGQTFGVPPLSPRASQRLPSTSHIPQALGPSTAHASQAPRSTSPQLSATMPRRAPGHHGGAAPGRLWTLRFVRWRRRDRREQAVSRVREQGLRLGHPHYLLWPYTYKVGEDLGAEGLPMLQEPRRLADQPVRLRHAAVLRRGVLLLPGTRLVSG